eukprot:6793540-Prymnesium_polylepis.1
MVEARFAMGVLVGAAGVVFIQVDPLGVWLLATLQLLLRTLTVPMIEPVAWTARAFWALEWEAHLVFSLLGILAMRARAGRQQHSVAVRQRLHRVLRSPWLGLAVPAAMVASALLVLVVAAPSATWEPLSATDRGRESDADQPIHWRRVGRHIARQLGRLRRWSGGGDGAAASSAESAAAAAAARESSSGWAGDATSRRGLPLLDSWAAVARVAATVSHQLLLAARRLRPALL